MKPVPQTIKEYRKELREALGDSFLRSTLDGFSKRFQVNRANSYKGLDTKAMTGRVAEVKDYTSANVNALYEKFKAEAEKRGVTVHRAATANEANAIIAAIARENDVKKIVKAKSMTTEETRLNTYLEAEGLEVTETDLGEWIVQLRKEGPSHIVAPSIHLSRQQVADLFTEYTGQKQTTDIPKLVKIARRALRKSFMEADMGISGVNYAVAENGAVVLVTNEGNARMVSTLPRVHVAVCGLDKLVDTIDSAMDLLQVVCRNAIGQALTAYTDWIDGANECGSCPDNKKIMHVVFLDNGRTALMKDPLFKDISHCLRCGACANVCPVYTMVGGHRMGYVYNGPIGLILTYFFHGRDKVKALIHNCIGCERCKEICGGDIDLPRMIREIRARIDDEEGGPLLNDMIAAVMKNRKLFHAALRTAKLGQKPVVGGGFVRHLPHALLPGADDRALPALAAKPFRDRFQAIKPHVAVPKYKVALFAGCAQDFIYPEQLEAAVKLLGEHGVAVDFPENQTCCGLPLAMLGQKKAAEEVAVQNVRAFDPAGYDAVLTLCASCGSHLKNAYPELLEGTGDDALRCGLFASKVMDFSSFVRDVLGLGEKDFEKGKEKVTYHAACHLCRGLGVNEAPRELIKAVAEYCPSEEETMCCGFGGTYAMKMPEMSAELLKRKLENAEASGATRLVMDCPGCVMQLRGGEERRGNKLNVSHISELLQERMKK